MIDNQTLQKDIKDFLGEEGIQYLQKAKDDDKLILVFGSFLYGNVGMQIRNHLIGKYGPEVYENGYAEFEDLSWELTNNLLK